MHISFNHVFVLGVLLFVVFWSTCSSCARFNIVDVIKKLLNSASPIERFETLDSNDKQSYSDDFYSIKTPPVDPKKWATMNNQGKSQFNHLDKNAKLIFANTPFKPECCPS